MRTERWSRSIRSVGLLCALCSTLCIVSLTGSPGADRVAFSCCLNALSDNGRRWGMDGGKWNGKMCMQTPAICKTGLGQAQNRLLTRPLKTVFFQWKFSPFKIIIPIPSFSHPDLQSNRKIYSEVSFLEGIGDVPSALCGCGEY